MRISCDKNLHPLSVDEDVSALHPVQMLSMVSHTLLLIFFYLTPMDKILGQGKSLGFRDLFSQTWAFLPKEGLSRENEGIRAADPGSGRVDAAEVSFKKCTSLSYLV
jgi:hypothetical protein